MCCRIENIIITDKCCIPFCNFYENTLKFTQKPYLALDTVLLKSLSIAFHFSNYGNSRPLSVIK